MAFDSSGLSTGATQSSIQTETTRPAVSRLKQLPAGMAFLIIALAVLLVWGKTIRYEFVWDDELFIVKNQAVYSLKNIPAMFFSKEAQSSLPDKSEVFRPLRTAQYAILRTLGGSASPQPWIYHLANICWHGAAAMLLFAVLCRLYRTASSKPIAVRGIALLMALGFAVHPVVTEVVCWAKSLDDIMAMVFVLAATRELLAKNFQRRNFVWSLIWFVLAVYSKESAVPFALLTVFIFRAAHHFSWKRCLTMSSGFFAITLIYLVHRRLVLGQMAQCPPLSGSYGQTLVDMLPVAVKYSRLLLGIPPFRIDYSYLTGHNPFFSANVLSGLCLVLIFIGLTFWLWSRPRLKAIALGLLWTELFLMPVSNLLPMMQYMADRFLYLPLIGLLMALGFLLLKYVRARLAAVIAATFLVCWIPVTWQRENIWQDELTLFISSAQEGPVTPRIEKDALLAIFRLPHMRALFPDYEKTEKLTLAQNLSPEQAPAVIKTLEQAQRVFPDNGNLSAILGIVYVKTDQPEKALPYFELSTRQSPDNPRCWLDLAIVLDALGKTNQAKAACETVLQLEPTNTQALQLKTQWAQTPTNSAPQK